MRSVDTNVLVRRLSRDDEKQAAAAEPFVQRGAWARKVALAEATWVLSAVYERDAQAIATAVELLLNHRDLRLEGAEIVAGALEIYRKRRALGFSDCLMLEAARKAGHLPLGTFDRSLVKLEGTEIL